jgi:hypothetical protein
MRYDTKISTNRRFPYYIYIANAHVAMLFCIHFVLIALFLAFYTGQQYNVAQSELPACHPALTQFRQQLTMDKRRLAVSLGKSWFFLHSPRSFSITQLQLLPVQAMIR